MTSSEQKKKRQLIQISWAVELSTHERIIWPNICIIRNQYLAHKAHPNDLSFRVHRIRIMINLLQSADEMFTGFQWVFRRSRILFAFPVFFPGKAEN